MKEYIGATDMRNKKLSYKREVISIPSASTIDLIYNYRVHAHPNDNKRYPYKKALFYTFREKGLIHFMKVENS